MAIFLLLLLTPTAFGIAVDNGALGKPEIECGSDSISIAFTTLNPFEGHLFVRGMYHMAECRSDAGGKRLVGLDLPFNSCNLIRSRSLNPSGIYVQATVVLSFHPQFITKVDQAYTVRCFYMETEKAVSSELDVEELTTAAFISQQVPMPVCRYTILKDDHQGKPIEYALIGQEVYHSWKCDTETEDTFCMIVHSCNVGDGTDEPVSLIDAYGCARDKYLLQNLEYLGDLEAGQKSHVFKFADRSQLYFNCQISIRVKEPSEECQVPECPETARGKRALYEDPPALLDQTMDVFVNLVPIDLPAENPEIIDFEDPIIDHNKSTVLSIRKNYEWCITSSNLLLLIGLIASVTLCSFISVLLFCMYRRKLC